MSLNYLTDTYIVGLIFTAFAVGIVAYFKWALSYWERKGAPFLKPTIPFGNFGPLITKKMNFGENFRSLYEQIKAQGLKHAGVYLFIRPMYIPTDPSIVKLILQSDFQHFINRGIWFNENTDPLSTHLFSMKDVKWKDMRVKLTPTFTSGKMKMMFSTMANCAEGLKNLMEKSAKTRVPVEIKDIMGRFTTDIIGSAAFGLDCNCLENTNTEFRKYGKKIFEVGFWQALKGQMTLMVPEAILDFFGFSATDKDVERFFMKVIRDTVEYREKNNIFRKDFLHLLLQLKNRGKLADDEKIKDEDGKIKEKGLTMNQLSAQAFVFFAAGFETSSTTITFALYELAQNQEIQDKLRNSINKILTENNNLLSYDAVMQMTYLDHVLDETLRKYPPLPMLNRQCNIDYQIPNTNVRLQKGDLVGIPIWGLHMDPEYYPNPTKFDPDRFTDENKKTRPAFTWLPFGDGPRQCIGLRFGLLQSKVGLITLLQNYKVTLDENKTQLPIQFDKNGITLGVDGGIWLNVEKIN